MYRTLAILALVALTGTEAAELRATLDSQRDREDDWNIIGGGSKADATTHEDITYGDASDRLIRKGDFGIQTYP